MSKEVRMDKETRERMEILCAEFDAGYYTARQFEDFAARILREGTRP